MKTYLVGKNIKNTIKLDLFRIPMKWFYDPLIHPKMITAKSKKIAFEKFQGKYKWTLNSIP